jgi:hypothetical protein
LTPTIRRSVRLPKVMKVFVIEFSRCGRDGVYAVYGAWDVRGSAQSGIYRNGFFILSKIFLKFHFFEISKLYYNIMSRLYIFPLKKGSILFWLNFSRRIYG